MQAKLISEIKDKGKADSFTSEEVLMFAMQEEASMMQIIGAGQNNAEMITSTCRYCGSSQPPRRYPVYGMTCGECGRVNHVSAVCRAPG